MQCLSILTVLRLKMRSHVLFDLRCRAQNHSKSGFRRPYIVGQCSLRQILAGPH